MSRKIKLLWDFRGDDAKKTAEHHTIHLKEFATIENLTFSEIDIQEKNPMLFSAFIIVDEADMKIYRDALKPHRGEVGQFIKNKATTKFETVFFIGKVVFYLFLIALIIGVIFLIRNVLKKNKSKKHRNHPLKKTPIKTIIITCKKCDSENNSNSKYCNSCSFELPKN